MEQNENQNGLNPLVNKHPPIWQELVIELFFRPRKFFSDLTILLQRKYVVPVAWVYGISSAIDRIDTEILKTNVDPSSGRTELVTYLLEDWTYYWGFTLASGAVSGYFLWLIGGWWYRKRLEWSGATDPDHRLVRVVYVYASFVLSAPIVLLAIISTIVYDNYYQAYNSEELWSMIILIFPFWSIITSYIGIRTTFEVSKWKARIWFLALPFLLYMITFGVLAAILVLLPAQ